MCPRLGWGPSRQSLEILLFVDDDNVLERTPSARIAGREGEFVPRHLGRPVRSGIRSRASTRVNTIHWIFSSFALPTGTCGLTTSVWNAAYPNGAGQCVRRRVMAEVRRQTIVCPLRQSLDRRGKNLLTGQDYDIILTACDMGLGCGVFQALKLTHLIPARRLTADYLVELSYGNAFSNAVLLTARGNPPTDPLPTRFKRVLWKARLRRQSYLRRAFIWAGMIGTHDGLRYCQRNPITPTSSSLYASSSGLRPKSFVQT